MYVMSVTNIRHIKETIFNYVYNYNYYVKHSELGRIIPMGALEENYNKRKEENKVKLRLI